jgi:hypothetical protein
MSTFSPATVGNPSALLAAHQPGESTASIVQKISAMTRVFPPTMMALTAASFHNN